MYTHALTPQSTRILAPQPPPAQVEFHRLTFYMYLSLSSQSTHTLTPQSPLHTRGIPQANFLYASISLSPIYTYVDPPITSTHRWNPQAKSHYLSVSFSLYPSRSPPHAHTNRWKPTGYQQTLSAVTQRKTRISVHPQVRQIFQTRYIHMKYEILKRPTSHRYF